VLSYTTVRDALIGVENMKAGGKAEVPSYVKPYLAALPPATPMDLESQLKNLSVLYPNNVNLETDGESRAG